MSACVDILRLNAFSFNQCDCLQAAIFHLLSCVCVTKAQLANFDDLVRLASINPNRFVLNSLQIAFLNTKPCIQREQRRPIIGKFLPFQSWREKWSSLISQSPPSSTSGQSRTPATEFPWVGHSSQRIVSRCHSCQTSCHLWTETRRFTWSETICHS